MGQLEFPSNRTCGDPIPRILEPARVYTPTPVTQSPLLPVGVPVCHRRRNQQPRDFWGKVKYTGTGDGG